MAERGEPVHRRVELNANWHLKKQRRCLIASNEAAMSAHVQRDLDSHQATEGRALENAGTGWVPARAPKMDAWWPYKTQAH
jgi:hypothetical protein